MLVKFLRFIRKLTDVAECNCHLLKICFSIRAHFLSLDPPSCASSRLQKLLKHISIRRLKTDQDDGRPLVKLPPRTVVIQEVELSEEERTLYDSMQKHGQLIITG